MHPLDLDEFARSHLLYEIATLTGQVRGLAARLPDITDLGFYDPVSTALGEASLVHLRLLDDFVGMKKRRHETDVLAINWPGGWRPTRFLVKDVRALRPVDSVSRRCDLCLRSCDLCCWARDRPSAELDRVGVPSKVAGFTRCASNRSVRPDVLAGTRFANAGAAGRTPHAKRCHACRQLGCAAAGFRHQSRPSQFVVSSLGGESLASVGRRTLASSRRFARERRRLGGGCPASLTQQAVRSEARWCRRGRPSGRQPKLAGARVSEWTRNAICAAGTGRVYDSRRPVPRNAPAMRGTSSGRTAAVSGSLDSPREPPRTQLFCRVFPRWAQRDGGIVGAFQDRPVRPLRHPAEARIQADPGARVRARDASAVRLSARLSAEPRTRRAPLAPRRGSSRGSRAGGGR
jgi:hypothetical protein